MFTRAGTTYNGTYIFLAVPVKDVVVAVALTMEQNAEQRVEVNIVGIFVVAQFTVVGKINDKFCWVSPTQIIKGS